MKRNRYGGGEDRPAKIPNQASIDERPALAEQRDRPEAAWEAGPIISSKHKQAIVTVVDSCTRMPLMRKVSIKTAEVN